MVMQWEKWEQQTESTCPQMDSKMSSARYILYTYTYIFVLANRRQDLPTSSDDGKTGAVATNVNDNNQTTTAASAT